MSEFISVYHLVLGTRPTKKDAVNEGGIDDNPDMHVATSPVDISLVASAIDLDGIYHFDDFGRFGVADSEARGKVKRALAAYGELLITGSPTEMKDFIFELHGLNNTLHWHRFGWLKEDLPDFDACHEKWKSANGMEGKPSPSLKEPALQSHIWKFTGDLLKTVIGDDAYHAAARGKYTKAISVLNEKGFRWSEHQKPALRRHLNAIVANATDISTKEM